MGFRRNSIAFMELDTTRFMASAGSSARFAQSEGISLAGASPLFVIDPHRPTARIGVRKVALGP
jgi:hypothetical protein